MVRKFAINTIVAFALLVVVNGCGTHISWTAPISDPTNPTSTAPRARTVPYYCGVSAEIDLLFSSSSWIVWMTPIGILGLLDMPLSFIADTVMLPVTIYVDRKYHPLDEISSNPT